MKQEIENIIETQLGELKNRIAENIVSQGRNTSGRTIRSLRVEPKEWGGVLWGRRPFSTLEKGRKSGKIPKNFRSVIIPQWMQDKGIKPAPIPYKRKPSENWQPMYTPEQRGIMAMAGGIAHNIKTKGTALYQKGGETDIYSMEIPETIEKIKKEIIPLFRVEIQNIPLNK